MSIFSFITLLEKSSCEIIQVVEKYEIHYLISYFSFVIEYIFEQSSQHLQAGSAVVLTISPEQKVYCESKTNVILKRKNTINILFAFKDMCDMLYFDV